MAIFESIVVVEIRGGGGYRGGGGDRDGGYRGGGGDRDGGDRGGGQSSFWATTLRGTLRTVLAHLVQG